MNITATPNIHLKAAACLIKYTTTALFGSQQSSKGTKVIN